jgi:lauroyl/myristoyl acyltransferase
MLLRSYKFLKFVFRHVIPTRLRYPLARWIARGIVLFNWKRRKVLVANLTPLVGLAKARALAPIQMGNFLMTAVDFFCVNPLKPRDIQIENWSRVEVAYKESRRLMIVTAHIGNWETGISYLVEKGYAVAGVYATYTDDDIVNWISSHRNPRVQWIPTLPCAADICVAAIEQGKILCIAADIPFGEHGRRMAIAGHHTRLPVGPWSIALRANATVIPAFILRQSPGRYRAFVQEPIKPVPGDSLRHQMVRMQNIYRGHLESFLKSYPEQWGNLQPYWEKDVPVTSKLNAPLALPSVH